MKRLAILLLTLSTILLACSASQADFPFRHRSSCNNVVSTCHEVAVVHEAAVVVPLATTTIIQQAVPTFLFSYNGYPSLPPSNYGQQYQQPTQPFQAPQAQQLPQVSSMTLTPTQMDQLASLVVAKLQAGTVASTTNLIAPPQLAPDEPVANNQAIIGSIRTACASCHTSGLKTSGGLAIFSQDGTLNPTKDGMPFANHQRLWQRASDSSMPPSATTNPNAKLNPEAIAFLKAASGQ